ncbi:MAG: EI24 domain-containing protein [Nibricoccus sp.]
MRSSPAPLSSIREAFTCTVLGLRDGFSPRMIGFSLGLWAGALAFWAAILVFAWTQVKAVAAFFTAWSLLGIFRLFPNWLPASAQEKITGVPLSEGANALLGSITFNTATWIMLVLLIMVAVYATVRIAVEFWLMPAIRKVVEKHYPPFPPRPAYSLLASVTNVAKTGTLAVLLGLPFLLVPVANVVLLFVLFGYLNVRTLVNEALDGLATREEQRLLIRQTRLRMILLGTLLGGAPAIPVLGLMTPAWTGAATCHLFLRALQSLRSNQ